jgi:hypothetical protein
MAGATASGDGPVDQRLPTRWTSPRRSNSCSRARTLSSLRPAAQATIAVENVPGISRTAARKRLSARGLGGCSGPLSRGAGSGRRVTSRRGIVTEAGGADSNIRADTYARCQDDRAQRQPNLRHMRPARRARERRRASLRGHQMAGRRGSSRLRTLRKSAERRPAGRECFDARLRALRAR